MAACAHQQQQNSIRLAVARSTCFATRARAHAQTTTPLTLHLDGVKVTTGRSNEPGVGLNTARRPLQRAHKTTSAIARAFGAQRRHAHQKSFGDVVLILNATVCGAVFCSTNVSFKIFPYGAAQPTCRETVRQATHQNGARAPSYVGNRLPTVQQ